MAPDAVTASSTTASSHVVRVLVDILTRVPVPDIEAALSRSAAALGPILPSDVESVLRQSYSHPASAVKFFRWAGLSLKHSPHAWNLVVDILGKNSLFEPMWDAIRSMRHEGALSVATFASAFSSYCSAGKIKEAVMTFDVMDRYGLPQDPVALNSLLSSICRLDGHTNDAADIFDRVKTRVPPDADTFAILLEGWEKEGNVQRAKTTFGEMVIRVGWNANNMSAYDAFLTTLVRAAQHDEAINFLKVMKGKNCLPGLKFFANALDILVKNNDAGHAIALWDLMVTDSGLVPNLVMYNAVIALLCNNQDFDSAYRLLDAMPFHGAFPDSLTYNTIFECLIRNRKSKEAEKFFAEMKKNEQLPSLSNCVTAMRLFFEEFDPSAAVEVWNYAVEQVRPDEDCANELLVGLSRLGRLSELRRYADEMLDMGVHLRSATMDKLQTAFAKGRREDTYELIARRVKRWLD
nr:pentatricopeptide repeat protein AaPPR354 [Agave angustifolia]